jgi:hypothetical protein
MKTNILREKATALENELADLYAMSEEAACFRYNVDYKQEAIDILNDEIQEAYAALKEAELEEEAKEYEGWLDPAFRTMADFHRMRI